MKKPIKYFNRYWPEVKSFLKRWNELLTIPLGFLLWFYSPAFLRWLDPTAAMFDAGIFQLILFAIIGALILGGVNWLIIKLNFPGIYHYIDNELEKDLWKISTKYRVGYALLFYFVHFLLIVLLVRAIPV